MNKLIALPVRCCLAASAALLSTAPAHAQQAAPVMAPAAAGSLEEVIVTARRREESMQDVPIAVSAFTADELRMLQAEDLAGLQGTVPNMNLVQGRGSANSANVYIRGIGQPDALQTFDPGVGIYLDDVYIARIQGALFNLYDVQRVEVLRGPQGTLYGKNTIAGAVRLISKKPPEEFAGTTELGYGNYDYFTAKAYLGGPVTDNFGASIAGVYATRDGITEAPTTGRDYNDIDTLAGRVILAFDPTEDLNINFAADYTRTRNALSLGRPEADLLQTDIPGGTTVLQPAPTTPWKFKVATSFTGNEGQEMDNWGTALTVGWQLNDSWLLKSITAYRSLEPDYYIDIDASVYELGDVFVGVDQDQTSQEFQFLYEDERLEAVMGLYYFGEDVTSDQTAWADDLVTVFGAPMTFTRTVADKLNTDSYAAFGQATWRFNDLWSGTVGLRYTDERKDYFRTTTPNYGSPLFASLNVPFEYKDNESWTAWTPTFALDYKLTPESLIYASASEGFKSGGFNGRANSAAETGAYDPEYVWTYELGTKNTLSDGRLRLNFDVFYSDYTDFQARVSELDADALVPTASFKVLNAGAMDIYGAELEATWIPIDALNLQAQVGYLHADYTKFTESFVVGGNVVVVDRSKDHPPFSPEWTMRLGAAYTFELGDKGGLTLSTDILYRDQQWLSVDNRDVLTQDAYTLWNVLLSWASNSNAWYASAGVKNITDETYKVDAQEFSSVGNVQTAYYGDPRTYQAIVGYRF